MLLRSIRAGLLVGFVGSSTALIGAPAELEAQQGRVSSALSGTAVPLAQLLWRTGSAEADPIDRADTDMAGRFRVPSTWSGEGWIEVRALSHQPLVLTRAEAEALEWQLSLQPDPLNLDALLVTAGGREQRRSEIAVPIAEVSLRDIRATRAPDVESLLSQIPGLQSQSGQPTGSNIMIRGIGDSRVLVLIDGQPASGALLENRDLSRLSLAGVERVEVVKGPLSSLYGTDALGGVINVVTREPQQGFRTEAQLVSGGQGRYEGDVTASGGGDLRLRTTASWRQQDRVPGIEDPTGVFSRVWDVRTTLRWMGTENVELRGDVSYVRERQRWPTGGGFSGFNDNEGVSAWSEATLAAAGGVWTAKGLLQDYEHLFRSARGSAPIAGEDDNLQKERLYRSTLMFTKSAGTHDFDVGVQGSIRSIESPDKILEDRASDQQLDLFAQDAWSVGAATLTSGVRATFNDRWGTAVSPTFGVSTLATPALQLRAVVGRGFRAPSFKELAWDFANLGGGYTIQGNADLDPETSWNVSAGADWAPSPQWSLGAEGYTNRIDNLIESSFVGFNPAGLQTFSPRNVRQARTQGVEVSGRGRFGLWEIRSEYVLLDAASLDDDLPLTRRARHSGRVRVARTFPGVLGGLLINSTVHGTGDAPIVGLDDGGDAAVVAEQKRFVSVDAQATLQLPSQLLLTLGVDNLLDARPDGWQSVIERRFRVGLEVRDLFSR